MKDEKLKVKLIKKPKRLAKKTQPTFNFSLLTVNYLSVNN
jgi:hypothetical protein